MVFKCSQAKWVFAIQIAFISSAHDPGCFCLKFQVPAK